MRLHDVCPTGSEPAAPTGAAWTVTVHDRLDAWVAMVRHGDTLHTFLPASTPGAALDRAAVWLGNHVGGTLDLSGPHPVTGAARPGRGVEGADVPLPFPTPEAGA